MSARLATGKGSTIAPELEAGRPPGASTSWRCYPKNVKE